MNKTNEERANDFMLDTLKNISSLLSEDYKIGFKEGVEKYLNLQSVLSSDDIYKSAIEKFGVNKQIDMLIEEMSELTQALLKHRRKPDNIEVLDNLHEEFADVTIVMRQIACILSKEDVAGYVAYKIIKLKQLIDKS